MKIMIFATLLLGLLMAASSSEAAEALQTPAGETPAGETPLGGDIEIGKAAATWCGTCHGTEGISRRPEVPHLAGQHAAYIVQALTAYKSGERADESMLGVLALLDIRAINQLAAYFSRLPPFEKAVSSDPNEAEPFVDPDPFAAAREATEACMPCHGVDGNSDLPGTPGLAGQHPEYTIAALRAYREGSRADETMQVMTEDLSDSDLETIAFFYAVAKPIQSEAPVRGDPFAGRAPAEPCGACHGENGNSSDINTPRLAGLDAEYLEVAIKAYQDGTREHDMMQNFVASLRPAEITNLAAYYATKKPTALSLRKPLTSAQWAQRCDRCHGPDGKSTDPRFPILAGQSETYLIKALKLYHVGERSGSMMRAMSQPMWETDINKLALYYARKGAR